MLAVASKRHFARLHGPFEAASRARNRLAYGSAPRLDVAREAREDQCPIRNQASGFHQVVAESSELVRLPVLIEERAQDHAEVNIGDARSIGIPVPDAEVHRATCDEAKQIDVGLQRGRRESRQDVQRRPHGGIRHPRQVDEVADAAAAERLSSLLVRLLDAVPCRMRHQRDVEITKTFDSGLDGPVTADLVGVQVHLGDGHCRPIDPGRRAHPSVPPTRSRPPRNAPTGTRMTHVPD